MPGGSFVRKRHGEPGPVLRRTGSTPAKRDAAACAIKRAEAIAGSSHNPCCLTSFCYELGKPSLLLPVPSSAMNTRVLAEPVLPSPSTPQGRGQYNVTSGNIQIH